MLLGLILAILLTGCANQNTQKTDLADKNIDKNSSSALVESKEPVNFSFPDYNAYLTITEVANDGYVIGIDLNKVVLGYKTAFGVGYDNKIDNSKIGWVSFRYANEVSDTNSILEYNQQVPKIREQANWMREIDAPKLGDYSIVFKGTNYEKLDKIFNGQPKQLYQDVYAREGNFDIYLFFVRKNKLIAQLGYTTGLNSDQNKVFERVGKYFNSVFEAQLNAKS